MTAAAALEVARQLYAEAREGHRLSAQHRRRAHERMEQLRAFCAAHGIAFELITRKDGDGRHGPLEGRAH